MTDSTISYDPPPEYADHLLATIHEVAARVGGIIITQEDVDLAYQMLLSASLEAIRIGSESWSSSNVPLGVSAIVAQAAARGFLNPEGYDLEANEGVRLGRNEAYVSGASLTPAEQRQVKSMAGRSGFVAVRASKTSTHWQARSDAGPRKETWFAPWTEQVGRKEFPFGSPNELGGG